MNGEKDARPAPEPPRAARAGACAAHAARASAGPAPGRGAGARAASEARAAAAAQTGAAASAAEAGRRRRRKPVENAPAPPVRPKEPQPEKPKPDEIAKALEREKSEPQPKPARVYDPNAIAKIIGQPKPQSAATASNGAGSATPLGLPHHDAPRMSVSMASALDAWLTESYLNCWTPPPVMPDGDIYVAQIKVVFNPDGSLSARPVLLNPPNDPAWRAHAESAMRAVRKCDPLRVPPQYAPYFEEWKIETIHFDPRETQG